MSDDPVQCAFSRRPDHASTLAEDNRFAPNASSRGGCRDRVRRGHGTKIVRPVVIGLRSAIADERRRWSRVDRTSTTPVGAEHRRPAPGPVPVWRRRPGRTRRRAPTRPTRCRGVRDGWRRRCAGTYDPSNRKRTDRRTTAAASGPGRRVRRETSAGYGRCGPGRRRTRRPFDELLVQPVLLLAVDLLREDGEPRPAIGTSPRATRAGSTSTRGGAPARSCCHDHQRSPSRMYSSGLVRRCPDLRPTG